MTLGERALKARFAACAPTNLSRFRYAARDISPMKSGRGATKVTAPMLAVENQVLAVFTRRAGAPPPGVRFVDDGDLILIQLAPGHAALDLAYVTQLDEDARAVGL